MRVHNWEILVHFSVHGKGKDLFGDGFAVWYTREKGHFGEEVYRNAVCTYCFITSFATGPIFGNTDYFTGLGIFFDTYSNYNGEHSVSVGWKPCSPPQRTHTYNNAMILGVC